MGAAYEVNFDGLVGTTHNYAGLSFGNVASLTNQGAVSHPKEAALQGLAKMQALYDLGFKQGVLPPHERPALFILRRMGYTGSDAEVLQEVASSHPQLLLQLSSAAAMWTANAATVTPSPDTGDSRFHITAANLSHKFHRAIEPPTTERMLKALLPGPQFCHHKPLDPEEHLADEGAANHTRFCQDYGQKGVHLFVYGRAIQQELKLKTMKYPARQTLEACEALARTHRLSPDQVIFAQQNPLAIDAGVFHNDVISVGNKLTYFYHTQSFVHQEQVLTELREKVELICGHPLQEIPITPEEVSLETAVRTYLFNSQLLEEDGEPMLIAPIECEELMPLLSKRFKTVHLMDVRQSMRNGGGPACLRQRIVLTEDELSQVNQKMLYSPALHEELSAWIHKYYRDELRASDLADPTLYAETVAALNELTQILNLGPIYPCQQVQRCC